MGQVVAALIPAVKGELEHLHPGEARLAQHRAHRRGEEAQVLGDDLPAAQPLLRRPEEVHPRPGLPVAVPGGGLPGGDGVVGLEAPEVVQAQDVIDPELEGQPAQPPGVALLFHPRPVKQGVAPQLPVGGEAVGGTAGHLGGPPLFVQLELLRTGPHVGAVPRRVDGQVSDDGDPPPVGPLLQGPPLGEEQVLHPLPEAHLPGQLPASRLQGVGPAQAQLPGPVLPGGPPELPLQGHEQGIVLQPVGRLPAEAVQRRPLPGLQPPAGQAEHRIPVLIQLPIVHSGRVVSPVQTGVLLPLQQPPAGQVVQVDEIGVAREGGEGLVGGVSVAGGPYGQDLPAGLPRRRQKVHKVPGRRPHCADAMGGGQAGKGHQNPRSSHINYLASRSVSGRPRSPPPGGGRGPSRKPEGRPGPCAPEGAPPPAGPSGRCPGRWWSAGGRSTGP